MVARDHRRALDPVRRGARRVAAAAPARDAQRRAAPDRGAARDRRLAARHRDHHRVADRRRHDRPIDPRRGLRPARPGRRDRVGAPDRRARRCRTASTGFSSPAVDGVLAITATDAAVVHAGCRRWNQPRAQLLEVDFRAARRFGGDPRPPGSAARRPRPGTAAISADLAHKLGVEPRRTGSPSSPPAATRPSSSTACSTGVGSRASGRSTRASSRTTCSSLPARSAKLAAAGGNGVVSAPPQTVLAFSNTGDVETGAAHTRAAIAAIDRQLSGLDARARPVKRDLLERADAAGTRSPSSTSPSGCSRSPPASCCSSTCS